MKYSFLDHEPFKVGDKVRVRPDFKGTVPYKYRHGHGVSTLHYSPVTAEEWRGRRAIIVDQFSDDITAYEISDSDNSISWIAEEVLMPCKDVRRLLDNHNLNFE